MPAGAALRQISRLSKALCRFAPCSSWINSVFTMFSMTRFLTVFYLLALALSPQLGASALQPVTLQLKWKHQFQFAGYYAALEKGYYRDAGMDVHILEAGPTHSSVETVVGGGADFGVSNTQLLLDKSHGAPVVALAAIMQHSPLSLVVLRDSGIRTAKDLAGRKLYLVRS